MKKFKKWGKRNWLNSVTNTSFDYRGSIEVTMNADDWNLYGELILRDSDKQVSIPIYVGNAKEFKQELRKLDIILDNILDLRDKMEEAYEYFEVASAERRKNKPSSALTMDRISASA